MNAYEKTIEDTDEKNQETPAKDFSELPDFDFQSVNKELDRFDVEDIEATKLADLYLEIQEKIKNLEKQASSIKSELLAHAQGSKTRIGNIEIVKCVKRSFDNEKIYEHFEMATGLSIEEYRKPESEYWMVREKKCLSM